MWDLLEQLGGERGWYSWRLAWWVRGFIDSLAGGPGMRRGRRDPKKFVWAMKPFRRFVFGPMQLGVKLEAERVAREKSGAAVHPAT